MADRWDQDRQRKLVVRGLGWCLCLALWTVALLTIYPVRVGLAITPEAFHFPAAKILHVSVYAFLTVYLKWIPLRSGRWPLLAFLSLHAFGTEFFQLFVPGRHGAFGDVFIDHVGLALGMGLTWKTWLPRPRTGSSSKRSQEDVPELTRSSAGYFRIAKTTVDNTD